MYFRPAKRADRAAGDYDAFVSYSRRVDAPLALALQQALHRFGKPWYRTRVLRVFRDDASLSANPGLWSSIETALEQSRFFVLLASPEAAASPWVGREVEAWCRRGGQGRLLLGLTAGEIVWDPAARDFDRARTTAVPPALHGAFTEEPRWVDLRWIRDEEHVSPVDPRFRDCVADFAAPIHGRPKDDLIGEDVRQRRRTVRLVRAAVATLTALALAASAAALIAVHQRGLAEDRARLALSRQLAAQAVANLDRRPALAVLQALKATRTAGTEEATSSLLAALQADQRIVAFLPHAAGVQSVSFSPDGTLVAVGDRDGRVTVWDVKTRTPVVRPFTAHEQSVDAIAVSPDGRTVATGDRAGHVALWDVRTGRPEVPELQPHTKQVTGIVWTPDSASILTAGLDRRLWRITRAGDDVHRIDLSPIAGPLGWIGVSGDATLVAAAAGDQIRVLDLRTGELTGSPLPMGNVDVSAMAFAPDNGSLAVGDMAGRTHLFRLRSGGRPTENAGHGEGITTIAWTADGEQFVTGGFDNRLVPRDSTGRPEGEPLAGHAAWVSAAAVQPGGGRLLASASLDGFVIVWDLGRRTRLGTVSTGALRESAVAYSPDGRQLAVGTEDRVTIRDPLGRRVIAELPGSGDEALAWSPDSGSLATTGEHGSTVIWDVGRRTRAFVIPERVGFVQSLAWSRDGRWLAVGGSANRVEVWDVARKSRIAELADVDGGMAGVGWVPALALSPDGRTLATGGWDGKVNLWNTADWRRRGTSLSVDAGGVWDLEFRSDGRVLAAGSLTGPVSLWDAERGRRLSASFLQDGRGAHSLAWSADGHLLGSVGGDATGIVLWNGDQGEMMGRKALAGHSDKTTDVSFSPDGNRMASTSLEELIVWETSLAAWQRTACALIRPVLEAEGPSVIPADDFRGVC